MPVPGIAGIAGLFTGTTGPTGLVMPSVRAVGTHAAVNSGSGSTISPGIPAGTQENDILLLLCETGGTDTPAPTGYTLIDTDLAVDGLWQSRMTLFWKRASSSESAPSVDRNGDDHIGGQIVAIQNCVTSGNPYETYVKGVTASSTSLSFDGLTTTINNALILVFTTAGTDTLATRFSGWTNASLSSVTEVFETASDVGNGGTMASMSGGKDTAGTVSATTATATGNVPCAYITIAMVN